MGQAPSGKVGAVTLPDGLAFYQAAAEPADDDRDDGPIAIHKLGLSEVARIHAEMDALAKAAGFADRAAFWKDRDSKKDLVLPATDAGGGVSATPTRK